METLRAYFNQQRNPLLALLSQTMLFDIEWLHEIFFTEKNILFPRWKGNMIKQHRIDSAAEARAELSSIRLTFRIFQIFITPEVVS